MGALLCALLVSGTPTTAVAEDSPPAEQTVVVVGERREMAASAANVSARELSLRPHASAGELLRATPGLAVIDHAGGKANQYLLRGFDADHGTDVALSFDGVPINLVSHAHGQGYADTSFIIPELVGHLEVRKGPYYVDRGDFATAGAIDFVSRESSAHSQVGVGFESSPGHGVPGYRALFSASPKLGRTRALFAADIGRSNGPFERPNHYDRYRLFDKLTYRPSADTSLSISLASYAGAWRSSGPIPSRAVAEGLVSRFGSLAEDGGGSGERHQLSVSGRARGPHEVELTALGYLVRYRLRLFSDFTYFLFDPLRGDGIEQDDTRTLYGTKLSARLPHRLAGLELATTLGTETRSDDVRGELWHAEDRARLDARKRHDLSESLLSVYAEERIKPARWLRFDLGVRADQLTFAVNDLLAPQGPSSGSGSARQLSPKGSVMVELLNGQDNALHLFGNYGHGFHSNDVRGAFASPAVAPLARAVGAEVGARAKLFGRWNLAATIFRLDLASETRWLGDEGTTESAGASTRRGVEVGSRLELTSFLSADLDLTLTEATFRDAAASPHGLPLSPKRTWAGGLSGRGKLGPGDARGAVRFFGMGERPATDDGSLVVAGFTELDLLFGYALSRIDLALEADNLLRTSSPTAAFATVSRLSGEPAVGAALPAGFGCGKNARLASASGGANDGRFHGCEDIASTPANPLTLRLTATLLLD